MADEYPADLKAEALKFYAEVGPAEAGRLTGVPSGTIRSWAHRAGLPPLRYEKTKEAIDAAQARADLKRAELRELLLDQALDMLHRMNEPHIDYRGKDADRVQFDKAPAKDCQSYMIAAATAIDKYRLEMGESTGRTESWTLANTDAEIQRLEAKLALNDPDR